jgi:hypothetical protein
MRSFFGEDPPQLVVRKQQRSIDKGKSHMSAQRAELAATVGPAAAKARAKEERAGAKDRFSQRLGVCSYMGCVNKEPPDGSVKFMRCKPCFEKMRRQVVYCSRSVRSSCGFLLSNHPWLTEHVRRQTGSFITRPYVASPSILTLPRRSSSIPPTMAPCPTCALGSLSMVTSAPSRSPRK